MMQIYYDEINNRVILNKEGYDDITFSNKGLFKDSYPLGHLLIEFIELNFDEIMKLVENNLVSAPESVDLIPDHITKLKELYNNLKDLHPYFWDYNKKFEKYITWYTEYSIKKITYKEILSHNEEWFNNENNIKSIVDVSPPKIRIFIMDFINKIITFEEFKGNIDHYLKEELKRWDIVEDLKSFIYDCKSINQGFKEAVSFCLDAEKPTEFLNLSTAQRFYLYQLKIDTQIAENNIRIAYKANRIDDEYENNIEELKKPAKFYTSKDLLKFLPNNPIKLYEVYELNVRTACYFEFIKLISKNILVKKCNNCHKYFINTSRSDTVYCDRLIEEGKTCKDVGAMNTYRESIKDDPIMKEYNKAYKKYNARARYKKMSKTDFFNWSEKAREMRDKAKIGKITLNEFKDWLNSN